MRVNTTSAGKPKIPTSATAMKPRIDRLSTTSPKKPLMSPGTNQRGARRAVGAVMRGRFSAVPAGEGVGVRLAGRGVVEGRGLSDVRGKQEQERPHPNPPPLCGGGSALHGVARQPACRDTKRYWLLATGCWRSAPPPLAGHCTLHGWEARRGPQVATS